MGNLASLESQVRVDIDTGELPSGQLLLGITVPTVAVQRRADLEMMQAQFNNQYWQFEDGDKLTVTCKDGRLVVRLTSAWGRG